MRLVEICVDGGLEATMYEAQAALADAYLEAGRAMEARIISEDLVAREPWNKVNIDRFRRALVMLGEGDPDAIIAERLSGESPFLATETMDLNDGVSFDTPSASARAEGDELRHDRAEAGAAGEGGPTAMGSMEIDLTEMLGEAEPAQEAPAAPLPLIPPPRSLDQVFRGMRDESNRASSEEASAEQYRLALTYHEMGMVDDAIKALEGAARSPRQRFDAASMLGRLYLERNDSTHAIEWLERAARRRRQRPMPAVLCSTIWPRRSSQWASSHARLRSSSNSNPSRVVIGTWPDKSNASPKSRREARLCSDGSFSSRFCSSQDCSWC